MALTRAQLLSGTASQGTVLSGQVQAVKQGTGIIIAGDGTIRVDWSGATGVVRLNNTSGFNSYIWPSVAGIAGSFLQTDGAGNLTWQASGGAPSGTVAPTPTASGNLWYDTGVTPYTLKIWNAVSSTWQAINGSGGTSGIAQSNTAVGYCSLTVNTTGINNTAFGFGALNNNTTGPNNTAVGFYALYNNTFGINNTATGWQSMLNNLDGDNNTAYGTNSLKNNSSGDNNTAYGNTSLFSNTSGSFNSALGQSSLQSNTTGINNTAMGYGALNDNTTGLNNTAINDI